MRRRTLLGFAAASLGALAGGVALGAEPPRLPAVEIRVIHATRVDGGGSIDPRLADLPQLTRDQPFVRFNVFLLLDRKRLPFPQGRPVVFELADDRILQVTLVEPAGPKSDSRYHLRVEIAGPGKKEFLKLLEVTAGPNEPFFVGGQTYKGGTLFLELALRE